MTRIDWLILKRIASRIGLTVTLFFGLILLVETIDSGHYQYLATIGGFRLQIIAMVAEAAEWLMKGLPLLVIVGTVIGVIDLQGRRELTAIKSSGASIWRIVRAPALALLLAGLAVTFYGESVLTITNRQVEANMPGDNSSLSPSGGFWLEQQDGTQRYLIEAAHVVADGGELRDVTIFLPDGLAQGRILAAAATLADGAWVLPEAIRYRAGVPPEHLENYRLGTATTAGDLKLTLSSTENMTFYELAASLAGNVSDTQLRDAVLTRFLRLLALPALLVGALFIAFAFTAGYRRTNGYGRAIVYAILIGFVVFVITEMADRAGSAGSLDPVFAACGPAFVAIVIGLTVLLYKEDGWA